MQVFMNTQFELLIVFYYFMNMVLIHLRFEKNYNPITNTGNIFYLVK